MDKKLIQRIAIIGAIIVLIVLFKVLGLGQYLTLDYLKSSQEKFAILYNNNQIAVIAVYMLIYIAVTALSLPGAAVMDEEAGVVRKVDTVGPQGRGAGCAQGTGCGRHDPAATEHVAKPVGEHSARQNEPPDRHRPPTV